MMYIEHTALEDNLHHILTNGVQSSSSPGATEAAAVAASALLARVREAQNGAPVLNAPEETLPENTSCTEEWIRRSEPKLLPISSLDNLPPEVDESVQSVHDLTHSENNEGEDDESYELLHVVDSDLQEEARNDRHKQSQRQEGAEYSNKPIENSLPTGHYFIGRENVQHQNKSDDEDEFEYVVTRVTKRRSQSHIPNQSYLHLNGGEDNSQLPTSQGHPKAKRPVPGAIPIEYHHWELLNNNNFEGNSFEQNSAERVSDPTDSALNSGQLNGFPESYIDCDDSNSIVSVKSAEAVGDNPWGNERDRKDAQMGLDIISKLRQLFNWSPSSSDLYSTAQQEGKRKRRSGDLSEDSNTERIKYRKVDNRFPKYVEHTEEDDAIKFVPPAPPQSPPQSSQQFQSNMSARRSTSSIDKHAMRKSMFAAPNITKLYIKNTSYADIEFSDDEEHDIMKPCTSSSVKPLPKAYNIPTGRVDERDKSFTRHPLPPPLIEQRAGNVFSLDHDYGRKIREFSERNVHVLGTRNRSNSFSIDTNTSDWSTFARSSILAQEKESEQRERYQQLLEQVVPRLYGSSTENKVPTLTSTERKRSGLLFGIKSPSSRSSSVNARRSVGLNFSNLKRPQLSSTINLDDDYEEDVAYAGVSHLKPNKGQLKIKSSLPTIVIDDDDISDIIELGAGERHVLSQVGKIKNEENSIINVCGDQFKKPKNKALPYVEPVNSLKDRFSSSPHIKDNWLDNWQNKWSLRKRNKLLEVQATAQVAEKLSAERKVAEAEIQERLRRFQIVAPDLLIVDDFEDIEPEPEFVELNEEHRACINAAVFGGSPEQVLISKFNLNITRRDVHTLCGHSWLNDEVINFYMNLLTERGDKMQSQGLPSVYAMNTFFVPRLLQAGHGGVKRWTRKVDIFAKDVIPLPVHVGGVHWCMAIIHLKNRTIKYYDSMGTPNPTVLKALEQYLKDESIDKRKQTFDTSGFQIESVQNVPRQMNGSDCGVFSCMFAEYITRNREITFSQQNMEYFRQKMIVEIVTGQMFH